MRRLFLFLLATATTAPAAEPDLFKTLDKNNDGKVSREEMPEQLRVHFGRIDTDGDGFVTRDEQHKATAPTVASVSHVRNIDYVGKGNPRQTLDILVPADHETRKRPLVIFVHGGGWSSGKKEDGLPIVHAIAATGDYVAATINYRLSNESVWPAQLHDCKAAIRFMRGKADEYGIDPGLIGVFGASAGGHLVSMLGTCGGNPEMEGNLGTFPNLSSRVQCVVNFFGPTDFLTMSGDAIKPNPITALLGGVAPDIKERARLASPVTWVNKETAPFLTAHGTKDPLVPYSQAEELHAALVKAGVESHLIAMVNAGHGFSNNDLNRRIHQFLDNHLRKQNGPVSSEPIAVK